MSPKAAMAPLTQTMRAAMRAAAREAGRERPERAGWEASQATTASEARRSWVLVRWAAR